MNIRKVALIASVALLLSLFAPIWRFSRTMLGIEAQRPVPVRMLIPSAVLVVIFGAVMPVFLFALYRDDAEWRIPKGIRRLSLTAAIIAGCLVIAGLRIESLDPFFTARGGSLDATARAIGHAAALIDLFSNAALLALLISFSRQHDIVSAIEVPRSRLLDGSSRAGVLCYGLVLGFFFIRILATPFTYSTLANFAEQNDRTMPPFSDLLRETIRDFLVEVPSFCAPFVIYKSQSVAVSNELASPLQGIAELPDPS